MSATIETTISIYLGRTSHNRENGNEFDGELNLH